MEHHAVSEKLLGCRAFEITDLKKKTLVVSPFPIVYEEFVACAAVVRFHLRRMCVFSCIARVTRLYFSNTSLHPGIEMGTCKMQESKELDEGFRVYIYLPNIGIRSAVKKEVVVLLVLSCYLHQDILLQD